MRVLGAWRVLGSDGSLNVSPPLSDLPCHACSLPRKRFHFQFSDYPEIVCTKVRDGDKRIVRLKEGDPKDKHIVIVDDLVQSGSTLIECQRLLASQGASHVSAYATHGVFPNESYKRFKPEGDGGAIEGFKYFWISDSCPSSVKAVTNVAPFEVLSLAEPIAAALQV